MMNEQVIADLLHSKRWSFAQIITLAEHQVVIGWVENSVRLQFIVFSYQTPFTDHDYHHSHGKLDLPFDCNCDG